MRDPRRRAVAETLLASVLWGSSFPVIKVGLVAGAPPVAFAALRFALTALLMLPLARALRGPSVAPVRPSAWLIGLGAINGAAFLLQYLGQARTSAVHAALEIGAGLPITAFIGAIVLRERLDWRRLLAVPLAMGGVFLVVTEGDVGRLTGGDLLGDGLAFGAALLWTAYLVLFKARFGREADVAGVTAWVFGVTALITLVAWPVLEAPRLDLPWQAWIVVAYTALFCSIMPFLLWSRALRHLSATVSSVLLTFETVVAVVLAFAFFGESLAWLGWSGASAILVASWLVSRR